MRLARCKPFYQRVFLPQAPIKDPEAYIYLASETTVGGNKCADNHEGSRGRLYAFHILSSGSHCDNGTAFECD